MDELEIGFYSAVAIYGLIFTWTLLVRLRWLPVAVVRLVRRPLNRLGRIPVLGRIVNACRKYSLSLGLMLAILVGVAAPYALLTAFWVVQVILIAGAVVLGFIFGGDGEPGIEEDEVADPIWDYDSDWAAARGRIPRS